MRAIALAVLLGALYILWGDYKKDMAELASLRDYKSSVEVREQVSDAGRTSFQTQKASAATQIAANTIQRDKMEAITSQVAHEDQDSADFLAMPIPERLRDADRKARLSRGLGAGQ